MICLERDVKLGRITHVRPGLQPRVSKRGYRRKLHPESIINKYKFKINAYMRFPGEENRCNQLAGAVVLVCLLIVGQGVAAWLRRLVLDPGFRRVQVQAAILDALVNFLCCLQESFFYIMTTEIRIK